MATKKRRSLSPSVTEGAAIIAAAPAAIETDLASLGRDNLAAVAQANAVLVKGLEEISQEVADYARDQFEGAVGVARALIGARSLLDVIALNRDYAQATLEGLLANSVKVSEIGMRVTGEAFEPLGERIAVTLDRLSRPAAA